MALTLSYKDIKFGVGDRVKVHQSIKEHDKNRNQIFEGLVISIKGGPDVRTFTVRKVGEQNVGIEKIFPLLSPTIVNISVVKTATKGVRRAKIYYVRKKSRKEIDLINSRTSRKAKD